MIRQIVVLAGGLATRLYPITKTVPKTMVKVAGMPFFEHQLELIREGGIEQVVMCVGHLSEQIVEYFGDGKEFGMSIVYSVENERLDTGGAIKHASALLDDEFFVTYGDSYLLQEYAPIEDAFNKSRADGLMCVYKNNNQIEPSRVLLNGEYVQQYTKDPPPPNAQHMEYGMNILKRSLIDQHPGKVFPISDYYDMLTSNNQFAAFHVPERFYEIGSKSGLKETEEIIRARLNK